MINNTTAEMVIALFWLIKPKMIKKTNNNAIILNCNDIIPLKCSQKDDHFLACKVFVNYTNFLLFCVFYLPKKG